MLVQLSRNYALFGQFGQDFARPVRIRSVRPVRTIFLLGQFGYVLLGQFGRKSELAEQSYLFGQFGQFGLFSFAVWVLGELATCVYCTYVETIIVP